MATPEVAFRSEDTFSQKEFRRWAEKRPLSDTNRYELIDGRIVMTPPASFEHARLEARIHRLLDDHVRERDLGVVLGSSAGYDLPSGETVEPDASFIAHARLTAGSRVDPNAFVRVVPNLVVEILSPATSRRDRTEKKALYERSGVDEYWIVDSRRREATVFRLRDHEYEPAATFRRGLIRSRVLPRLRITIDKLFES